MKRATRGRGEVLMCGIAGSFGRLAPHRIDRMITAIQHRGPDSRGECTRGRAQLGICRLSIIDPQGGDQPISNETGDKTIVFNGEIYNYRPLKDELKRKGHVFATNTDTEVVLHCYEEYGRDCVQHLRGMFTFAITDGESLFIARDRLGIKPLYCWSGGNPATFLFASEIKALLQCPEVDVEIDHQALVDDFLMHIVEPMTMFRGIESLEAGCTLQIRSEGDAITVDKRRYYRPQLDPDESITFDQAERTVHEMLTETVAAHLIADVDVAIMLSGGLDSCLLAAAASRGDATVSRAFTIASAETYEDVVSAKRFCAQLGLAQDVLIPTFDEYLSAIPAWVASMETVATLGGLPVLLLCRSAAQHVKVCLCGEGSDEVFGGYDDFAGTGRDLIRIRRRLPEVQAAGFEPSERLVELIRKLIAAKKAGPDSYLRAIFEHHQDGMLVPRHLNVCDKAAMAAGVELRVPYVDHLLVDFVNRVPLRYKVDMANGRLKRLLRQTATDYYSPLLDGVARRQKLGMPSACFDFHSGFDRLCSDLLPADYRDRHPLGRCFFKESSLVLYELFETIFLQNRGTVPVGLDMRDFIQDRATASARRLPTGGVSSSERHDRHVDESDNQAAAETI